MDQQDTFIEYLSTFMSLSDRYTDELKKQLKHKQVAKGTIYFDRNTYSKKLSFLTKGIMRIYDIDESGHEWNKVFLSPPSLVLGNPNLEEKSTHYIETISPCEVWELPIDIVKTHFLTYPETRVLQTKLILQLFEKKSKREYDFLTLNAKERYLKCLEEYRHIIHEIPQFHIASYLGITTTQLSRINVSLKNQQM